MSCFEACAGRCMRKSPPCPHPSVPLFITWSAWTLSLLHTYVFTFVLACPPKYSRIQLLMASVCLLVYLTRRAKGEVAKKPTLNQIKQQRVSERQLPDSAGPATPAPAAPAVQGSS